MLSRVATPSLPSFPAFASKLNEVVGWSDDPYHAIMDSEVDLDRWYNGHQLRLVTELQIATGSGGELNGDAADL